jgi:ammonium transporter, Amt family
MNKLQKTALFQKVDDTLSVFSTHGVAGLMGGLLVGVLADSNMLVYIGTDKDAPGVSVTAGLHQLLLQAEAAAFIIVFNAIGTFIILKIISIFVSLRMPDSVLAIGDDAVHGEEAYALDGDPVAPGVPAE